ncbi:MAG: methyltransferase regulatory domain-containing protein [Planctomyces sp.]|nr:methyltransferase regulatory domain-containing protein [Planctomyces sp.]
MPVKVSARAAQDENPALAPTPANTYDQVPYRSFPFRQTHPNRLAVIATLHGMAPAPIDRARILELGCASGGNLIPMAEQLPGATCLGIDGSQRQIDAGRQFLTRAGLKNVELRCQNILDFDGDAGSFDYVLCHGVYSWVPDEVQRRILEICGRCLSPQGVAYVSYNTYPGWRMRGMIRDIMRYRAQFFSNPSQQLTQARSLLRFLSESVKAENNAYGILLKSELESILSADDSYLFHEHLEETNEPLYFHQFYQRAETHGLQYLGEADYASMSLDNFPDHIRSMLQTVSRDLVEIEQYMDFLRNRTFRQTLLCRRDIPLDRTTQGRRLLNLQLASNSAPEAVPDAPDDGRTAFRRGSSVMTTSDPVVRAAMTMLHANWPRPIPFLELAAAARSHGADRMAAIQVDTMSPATLQLADTLLRCHATAQVDLHFQMPEFVMEVSERPRASVVARLQAEDGSQVTDRTHGTMTLDDFHRQTLMLLDGEHDRARLLDKLSEGVRKGTLLISRDGQRVTDSQAVSGIISEWLDKALAGFARMALLVG